MNIQIKWYYRLGFTLLLFIVLFVFIKLSPIWLPIFKVMVTVLLPFIIGAFITYLLHPVVEYLHKQGLQRGLSVFLIYLLFFGGIGFSLYKGIPVFIEQLQELTESAPQLANQYRDWIEWIQEKTKQWPIAVQEKVDNGIQTFEVKLDQLFTKVVNGAMKLVNATFILLLIPFISFYLLKDITTVKKAAWHLTPKRWREEAVLFVKDVNTSLGSYIRGQIMVCTVIGVICSLAFWFFHLKFSLVLGIIIGITNVIPYFGPIIGAIPAVIVASTMSVKMIMIVCVIIAILQFLEGNILSPMVVGKSLHMHPVFIMFALLLGGEVGGIVGMIVSVPILSVLKVSVIHLSKHFGKKNWI